MSIKIMSLVFEKSKTKLAARLVLLALADMASDEGVCFPSVKKVGSKAGVSEQVAREYLHAFKEIGLISIDGRSTGDRQTSNLYTIHTAVIGSDSISKSVLAKVRPPSRVRGVLHSQTTPSNTPDTGEGITPSKGGDSNGVRDESSLLNHHNDPSNKHAASSRARPAERILLDVFIEKTGLPESGDKKMLGKRWYQPIRRMSGLANGSGPELMGDAIQRMRADKLTITSPQSVEGIFNSLLAERADHDGDQKNSGGHVESDLAIKRSRAADSGSASA